MWREPWLNVHDDPARVGPGGSRGYGSSAHLPVAKAKMSSRWPSNARAATWRPSGEKRGEKSPWDLSLVGSHLDVAGATEAGRSKTWPEASDAARRSAAHDEHGAPPAVVGAQGRVSRPRAVRTRSWPRCSCGRAEARGLRRGRRGRWPASASAAPSPATGGHESPSREVHAGRPKAQARLDELGDEAQTRGEFVVAVERVRGGPVGLGSAPLHPVQGARGLLRARPEQQVAGPQWVSRLAPLFWRRRSRWTSSPPPGARGG